MNSDDADKLRDAGMAWMRRTAEKLEKGEDVSSADTALYFRTMREHGVLLEDISVPVETRRAAAGHLRDVSLDFQD